MARYLLIPKRFAQAQPALAGLLQWLEARLFQGVFWLLRQLPLNTASSLAGTLFSYGGGGAKAATANTNLATAFPGQSADWRRATVKQLFRHLGIATVELIKLEQIWAERAQRLEVVMQPQARAWLEAKQAAVFVTAHVGAWQLVNLISLHAGLTISTVYAPESNPMLRAMLRQMRAAFGVSLIPSTAGIRPLLRELNRGHSIGIAMDTRLKTGQPVEFFGRPALTNTSAARLALRTGSALIPIRGERLAGGRFRVTVYDPLSAPPGLASAEAQALAVSRDINRHFEQWIRATPGEWICLKRRWPKAHRM